MEQVRFLISGGGTGGHIFPAISIANELSDRIKNSKIEFVGAKNRMEMEKIPENGYSVSGLWISGIKRSFNYSNLLVPFQIIFMIDLEILLANSLGRLEGVNKYNEVLKEISIKYPTSAKSKQLIKISNKINRKWKEPNKLTKSDDFKIVFVLSKMDFSYNQIKESLRLIEKTIDVKKRVSYDVYDYDRALIVIHDYTNRDDAENDIFKIKQELEGFQLKNNFVSLSSQYKNMLIYKTLELE